MTLLIMNIQNVLIYIACTNMISCPGVLLELLSITLLIISEIITCINN